MLYLALASVNIISSSLEGAAQPLPRPFGAWEQHAESAKLELAIKANLKGQGYGL